MIIVRNSPCPHCKHLIRVSVESRTKGRYIVRYFDGRDKNGKVKTATCPYCKIDLFKTEILKSLTGLETAQLDN